MVTPTKATNPIRRLRFERGELTPAELAWRIGVTCKSVIAIEQGRCSPSLEPASRIARALRVCLEDVFQYPAPEGDAP